MRRSTAIGCLVPLLAVPVGIVCAYFVLYSAWASDASSSGSDSQEMWAASMKLWFWRFVACIVVALGAGVYGILRRRRENRAK